MTMMSAVKAMAATPPKTPSPIHSTSNELSCWAGVVVWEGDVAAVDTGVTMRMVMAMRLATLKLVEASTLSDSALVVRVITVVVTPVTTTVSPVDFCTSGAIACANSVLKALEPVPSSVVLSSVALIVPG